MRGVLRHSLSSSLSLPRLLLRQCTIQYAFKYSEVGEVRSGTITHPDGNNISENDMFLFILRIRREAVQHQPVLHSNISYEVHAVQIESMPHGLDSKLVSNSAFLGGRIEELSCGEKMVKPLE